MIVEATGGKSNVELIPAGGAKEGTIVASDGSAVFACDLDISKARRLIGAKPCYTRENIRELLRSAIKALAVSRMTEHVPPAKKPQRE
jgi:hypothetical protein